MAGMVRSLRFWLVLALAAVVVTATVAVVVVLVAVLLPRLNDQVESNNRALGISLARQVDDFLRDSAEVVIPSPVRWKPDHTPQPGASAFSSTRWHMRTRRWTRSTFSMHKGG